MTTPVASACLGSAGSFFNSPFTDWIPIAIAGVSIVAAVLAIIYIVSPLLGRQEVKTWARAKMYEVFFGLVVILVFAGMSTSICVFQPIQPYSVINLVPSQCNSTAVNSLYGLSECDLYTYNEVTINALNTYAAVFTAALSDFPKFSVTFQNNYLPYGVSTGIADVDLEPHAVVQFVALANTAMGGLIMLSQLQLLLLDISLLIFAIFMPLGLILRMFGITRSYGGTLIAFGMGIGIVFPLITSISYGFIDQVGNSLNIGAAASSFFSVGTLTAFLAEDVQFMTGIGTGNASLILSALIAPFNPFLEFTGLVVLGSLMLPLLSLTIVNTFVLDFSQAVGERMSFMDLLARVV
ncbi:MAG: hypothetical protein KGH61_00870 [Candidatus Micrarchaeota archaeon]|nr:hypothetical protein [Candidatus Micrarchaeota archaeon]MDE1847486.1 hypothetical protein [Candidatus Micrarchaeota archaeon]MDE1863878.1 hypothetical protein [Candidatus Micrarchaeota archaeon]